MGNSLQPPQTSESDLAWGWGVLVISTWISLIGITMIIIYTSYQFYLLHKFHKALPLTLEISSMTSFVISWFYVLYQFLTWSEWFTSTSDCKWILDALIILLSLTKCSYYWFLTVRLQVSFDTSIFRIKRVHLWALRIISIGGTLIMAVFVVRAIESPKQYSHDVWGLYCGQLLPIHWAIIYGAYDGIISGICVYCFVSRLSKVAQSVINFDELIRKKTGKSAMDYRTHSRSYKSQSDLSSSMTPTSSTKVSKDNNLGPPSIDIAMPTDIEIQTSMSEVTSHDSKINNLRRAISAKSKEKLSSIKNIRFSNQVSKEEKERLKELRSVKRDWKRNNKLFQLGKVHTVLTIVSVLSTQVIFGIGFTFWPPATFIIMIDTLTNCICFLCMFRFMHVMQRIDIAGPFCWMWCCWPFSYICYNEKINEKLDNMKFKYKVSMGMIDRNSEEYMNRNRKRRKNKQKINIGNISPVQHSSTTMNKFPYLNSQHERVTSTTATDMSTDIHHIPQVSTDLRRAISDFSMEDTIVKNDDRKTCNHLLYVKKEKMGCLGAIECGNIVAEISVSVDNDNVISDDEAVDASELKNVTVTPTINASSTSSTSL